VEPGNARTHSAASQDGDAAFQIPERKGHDMTTQIATTQDRKSILLSMATKFGMEPAAFEQTVRATCGCDKATKEQFAAFLLVANEYGLNPVTREIYAFPTRGGGIQPIVGIDGWMTMANNHPAYDGITFVDRLSDDGQLVAITAQVHRKDRSHPVEVTEYLAECRQGTDPWKKWPARMLRHKAAIQAIRYAFGFSGIVDPDEADRMRPQMTVAVNVQQAREQLQHRRFAQPAITVDHEDGGTDFPHEAAESEVTA
jgi:phage recombination protein Bet